MRVTPFRVEEVLAGLRAVLTCARADGALSRNEAAFVKVAARAAGLSTDPLELPNIDVAELCTVFPTADRREQVLQAMGDRPVTIRTLDLGGDKVGDDEPAINAGQRLPRQQHGLPVAGEARVEDRAAARGVDEAERAGREAHDLGEHLIAAEDAGIGGRRVGRDERVRDAGGVLARVEEKG
jgi:hypothetical protein